MCFSWICDVFNKPKCELDYDSAQRDLSWDIYYTKGIDQKPKKTWVEPYLREETLGIANLQRQHRLLKRYEEELRKPIYKEGKGQLDESQHLHTVVTKLCQELKALRAEYWIHKDRLYKLEVNRPYKIIVRQIMVPRQYRDRHNRRFAWTQNRAGCASRGGCCSRGCRCCEKGLDAFILSTNKCRERAVVYGHCTGECACCIEAQGRYVQHAGLPSTEF